MKRLPATLVLFSLIVGVVAQDANDEPRKRIFLPRSSKQAAYMLMLQSNEELVQIVRDPLGLLLGQAEVSESGNSFDFFAAEPRHERHISIARAGAAARSGLRGERRPPRLSREND